MEDSNTLDLSAYKNKDFLKGLFSCNTNEDIKKFIDQRVDYFLEHEQAPEQIGISDYGNILNGGQYQNFIAPSTKVSAGGSIAGHISYHFYDRSYLYQFALFVKNNINHDRINDKNAQIVVMNAIMGFLDEYFGLIGGYQTNEDKRTKILEQYAYNNAEALYKHLNIPLDKEFEDYTEQLEFQGDYPIQAFKNNYSAQCTERSSMAHNILKVCGYNCALEFGLLEYEGKEEEHAWNTIYDQHGNKSIVDFTLYTKAILPNNKFHAHPFYYRISAEDYNEQMTKMGYISGEDYYYEFQDGINQKKYNGEKRKYAVGKTHIKNIDDEQSITM